MTDQYGWLKGSSWQTFAIEETTGDYMRAAFRGVSERTTKMKYILEIFTGLDAEKVVVSAFGKYDHKRVGAEAEPPADVGFDGPHEAYAFHRETEEECNTLLDSGKRELFGLEDCAFFIYRAPEEVAASA